MWVPTLLLTPAKIRIFRQKTAKFGPFGPLPGQITMRTRCLDGLSVTWVLKILLPPKKNKDFWPKKANQAQKYAFVVILGQILAFLAHLVPCPTNKQCKRYVSTKIFSSSDKNQDFWPKNDQILPKICFWAHVGLGGSFGALLVGWRSGSIL